MSVLNLRGVVLASAIGLTGTVLGVVRSASILQDPDQFRGIDEIEGKVQSVEIYSRVIGIKDDLGHIYQINVSPETPITDINRGTLKLSDLTENETLHVYYDTRDMSARHIDRVSRGLAGFLLSPS
jgi:hypothetical protein